MKRICIVQIKGGDGKSTLSHLLSRSFINLYNYRMLLADFDNQASLSTSNLTNYELAKSTTFTCITDDTIVVPSRVNDKLDIIPADHRLTELDLMDWKLLSLAKKKLALIDGYDLAIFDTAGHDGNRVAAVLNASDALIIPLKMLEMSIQSLNLTIDTIKAIMETTNPNLNIIGIVPMAINTPKNGKPTQLEESRIYNRLVNDFGELILPSIGYRPAIMSSVIKNKCGIDELPVSIQQNKALVEINLLTKEIHSKLGL